MLSQCCCQAREAYERALALEPEDRSLQDLHHRADVAERKAAEECRHRFRGRGSALRSAGTPHQQTEKARVGCCEGCSFLHSRPCRLCTHDVQVE